MYTASSNLHIAMIKVSDSIADTESTNCARSIRKHFRVSARVRADSRRKALQMVQFSAWHDHTTTSTRAWLFGDDPRFEARQYQ